MYKYYICLLLLLARVDCFCQKSTKTKTHNQKTLDSLQTQEYESFKNALINQFSDEQAGKFGVAVKGVYTHFESNTKAIALTFDACIGKPNDYNAALIALLRKEKIPATLFVTESWVDYNLPILKALANDSLFEIEDHGLFHRVCSVNGKSVYHIRATKNRAEVIDEMDLNAIYLSQIKGERPHFFRPPTAFIDEESVKIADQLGLKVVNFDLLPGDAIPFTPALTLKNNLIKNAHAGAIVLMHFNHPEWYEVEALKAAIPILRAKGYSFVKLNEVKLIEQ